MTKYLLLYSYKLARPLQTDPDSKIYGASMGPIWGRQDPGGPHVSPMNLTIWGVYPSFNQVTEGGDY